MHRPNVLIILLSLCCAGCTPTDPFPEPSARAWWTTYSRVECVIAGVDSIASYTESFVGDIAITPERMLYSAAYRVRAWPVETNASIHVWASRMSDLDSVSFGCSMHRYETGSEGEELALVILDFGPLRAGRSTDSSREFVATGSAVQVFLKRASVQGHQNGISFNRPVAWSANDASEVRITFRR